MIRGDSWMSEKIEEMRTIFFNGPKGHRWVTTVAPNDEDAPAPPPPETDDRAADRRRFFGFLNAMHDRLERYGVSAEEVRAGYAERFAVDGMSRCSQRLLSVGDCSGGGAGDVSVA